MFNMDLAEKDVTTSFTTTSFSTWSGPDVENDSPPLPPVRGSDDLIKGETATWSDRLFCITDFANVGTSIGPGISPDYGAIDILHFVRQEFEPFKRMYKRYAGFRYDAIDVRITATAPKAMVGGIFVGWWPYVDFFDEGPSGTRDVYLDNAFEENCIAFINSANTSLMLLGDSTDVQFAIPWSFKQPYLPTHWIEIEEPNSDQSFRPVPGWPILYWKMAPGTAFVSSISSFPAKIQIYLKFVNPVYYGPIEDTQPGARFEVQSGAEPLAAAAIAMAAEEGISYIADAMMGPATPGESNKAADPSGSYSEPQAVQMSYFGDTTSTGFPTTHPIFRADMLPTPAYKAPTIHDFLSRPQLIRTLSSGETHSIVVSPFAMDDYRGSTYFGYFGMINQLWRGTIIFDVVVAGHDFVELEVEIKVLFPGGTIGGPHIDHQPTYRGIFSGSKTVTVPFPYLYPMDYLPVYDKGPQPDNTRAITGMLSISVRVVSTMLDVVPVIPTYLFARAGPDFKFYQPYPPGLYNISQSSLIRSRDFEKMEPQVNLPNTRMAEVFETTAQVTPDPKIYASYDTVYEYMKLWARAIPFADYNNSGDEEPIPDAATGLVSPCWFPPVDRARYVQDDNSWFCTQDYVSYLSILFLYWRGSIGAKIAFAKDMRSDHITFGHVAIGPIVDREPARMPWTADNGVLPPEANFGIGAVATPLDLQPVLEVSVPYRGLNLWGYTIYNMYQRGVGTDSDLKPGGVHTNIELVNGSGLLADSMYRKIDSDFALCFESVLPPYAYWRYRGHAKP